jgi:hypothetical protein
LNSVLFDEEGFIEYKSSGGGSALGSEFGDAKPVKQEAPREEVTKARANKVKQETPKQVEPDFDNSQESPF